MGLNIEQQGEIIIYTFTDSSDESVDTWAISLEGLLASMAEGEPCLVMLDISAEHVTFGNRAREKSSDLFAQFQTQSGYFAFIFSDAAALPDVRAFFTSLSLPKFEIEYFHSSETALRWLRSQSA